MADEHEPRQLTSADIRALKNADNVVFQTSPEWGHRVRAIREREHTQSGFSDEVQIQASGGIRSHGEGFEAKYCFHMIHSSKYSRSWQTIASLLRPGDTLSLSWSAGGGTTENHRAAGLHGDTLSLVVYRKEKHKYTFKVAYSVCPNNSARMCRDRP
jgi:hypothetical protein